MLQRPVRFYLTCFVFGLSVLLIIVGSRYADNTYYRLSMETRGNTENFVKIDDGEGTMLPQNADQILEETKAKVNFELLEYNFTHSGVNSIKDLTIESGGTPIRTLVISTWRSGTTFLGEVLNAIPSTFYLQEPLLHYGVIQIRGPPQADRALSNIKDMFKCNFYGMNEYFEKVQSFHMTHNSRLWDYCKYKKDLCWDADFTSKFCRLFPFLTIKLTRIRLHLIQEILEDKEFNIKVLLLIRDPRGVMQSRQHCNFCHPAPDCSQPELLCADMISDYIAARELLPKYPDRIMVLRYEELALEPNLTTHRILKFLKLSVDDVAPSVEKFLQSHTNVEVGNIYSTFRVSRDVPFRWKSVLDFNNVERIQTACKQAMDLWGYRTAHNGTHMASRSFNPLQDYTIIH